MTDGLAHEGRAVGSGWRQLRAPDDVAGGIVDLYRRRGAATYDEVVTQSAHARQTGAHAMAAGAADELVLAAFLHDIGHLLVEEAAHLDRTARAVDLRHQVVGARFLANWFGPGVTGPVELHVEAKRYLCAVDAGYRQRLSPASRRSLALQGGPLATAEIERFEARPGYREAVDLRRWDDEAKAQGAAAPSLEVVHGLVVDVLSA